MDRARAARFLEATGLLTGVKAGDFASWPASKGTAVGKVVSIHSSSKVPGVPHLVTGTKEKPAARIRLYAKKGNGYVATDTHLGHSIDNLTVIDALAEPSTEATALNGSPSFDDIRAALSDALTDRIVALAGVDDVSVWICDAGIGWAVYRVGYASQDLWLITWSMDGEGVFTFDDPVEVQRQTQYVADAAPIDGPTGAELGDEGSMMEATDHVSSGRLLAAGTAAPDGGRIFHVQIITYGDSKNGRRYTESVMRAAAPMYEGAKAFDHHRTDQELSTSTIQGLVGHYQNVTTTGHGIEADLHLLPSASHVAEVLDRSLESQAAGLPPLVGLSHDITAKYRMVVDGGRRLQEATQILSVNSTDIVAHPAAGGIAMRMVAGGPPTIDREKEAMTLKQLLELLRLADPAKKTELLRENASLITANGLSDAEALRMAEAVAPPVAAPAPLAGRQTEAAAPTFGKASTLGRMLITAGMTSSNLPERLAESITAELPESFTEADLAGAVASARRLLEAAGIDERAGLVPVAGIGSVRVSADQLDKKRARVDAMLAGDYANGYRSFKEAYIDVTGARPRSYIDEDFNREILRESAFEVGQRGDVMSFDSGRSTESVQSSTWGFILGDSVTRRMVAYYQVPNLNTWRSVVSSIVPVNDFRTQRIDRLGGYGVLPAVTQGTAYQPLTSPGNEEASWAISKRGGTEDLTLETIANDDLRQIIEIPKRLGIAAAQTLYRFVWDMFDTNITCTYDSTALFAAGHNNQATSALSRTAMDAARLAMRSQTAYGDASMLLSIVPRTLVVSKNLENFAWTLANSAVAVPTGSPDGGASNIPNIHAGLDVVVVDYWSSTTKWIAVADTNMVPTIEIGFYQGQQDPQLFVQNDPTTGSVFTNDKITWKIRHIYGGTALDHRGVYRGNT